MFDIDTNKFIFDDFINGYITPIASMVSERC